MSDIVFNNIPGAGLSAPIFSFEVNSGGQYQQVDRFIIVGKKTAAGTMALNSPVPVFDQNTVDAFAGPGSQLREMFRICAQNAPAAPFWIMAIDDSSLVAATWTNTIGTLPGVGVGTFEIMGEQIQIPVGAADTPTTIAAAIAAAVNAYYNPLTGAMLPVTATSAAAVLTYTARNKGLEFNEVDFYVNSKLPNNIFAASGVWTLAAGTAGSGSPSVAAALAVLGDDPADYIVSPWSDATSLGVYNTLDSDVSGRWAWLRQSYGHVWSASVGSFSALTTLGLTLNDRHTTVMGCIAPGANGTPHPTWLWVSAIAARLQSWLSDCVTGNVSRNHSGLVLQGIRAPRDRSVWPNYNGRNVLINSGISTFKVGADGSVQIDKIVTTYRTGTSGNPDTVFRDIQAMYQVAGGLKYMRAVLAQEHGTKAIADSNPGSLGAISTPADIQATFIHAYSQLCTNGVFEHADTFAQLLTVQRNSQNPARVDAFVPLDRVNPLDILAANATVYQAFPGQIAA